MPGSAWLVPLAAQKALLQDCGATTNTRDLGTPDWTKVEAPGTSLVGGNILTLFGARF